MIVLGAVFARGNSKGIKNKNLLQYKNKTLVGHAVDQGNKSKFIKSVYISSDNKKIINEAKKYKAIAPFKRPKSLSSDTAKHIYVWRHFINHLKKNKVDVDYIVDIPTCTPLRNISDLDKCIKLAVRKNLDMVHTITKSSKNPYFNMLEKKGKKFKIIKTPKKKISRRQDAPTCFDLANVCYVFKPKYILKTKDFLSGKVGFIEIPKERAIDIDDKIDYKVVSILSKKKNE